MSAAAAPALPQGLFARIAWHWENNPKADLWLAWYSIPIAYNVMGICYFTLTHMMPPPKATKSQAEVVEFLTVYGTQIQWGFAVMMVALGFLVWANGLIGWLIMRMQVPYARAWGYAYMVAMCGGSLTGAYMSGFTLSLAAMRPERSPELSQVLYDLTYLSFDGTMGFFLMGSLIWTFVILTDKSRVFPKWFGYTCIWNFTTEFLVATSLIVQDGPFAWDGTIAFYIDVAVYILWQIIYAVVLFFAVRRVEVPMDEFRRRRGANISPPKPIPAAALAPPAG